MGINAQVGEGLINMVTEVNSGNPVIAGVRTLNQVGPVPAGMQALEPGLHAVVVEGMELRGGQLGVVIYDPVGSFYWQPVKVFQKFFNNEFIKPL